MFPTAATFQIEMGKYMYVMGKLNYMNNIHITAWSAMTLHLHILDML